MKIPRYGGALETLEINVDGSHVGVRRRRSRLGAHVVLASTSDVYGKAEPPFREDDPIVLGPPTSRRWSYAASKYFDEHLALRMVEERDLQCTILRFFNAYGSRNHPTWWGGPLSVFFEDLLDGAPDGAARRRPPDPLVHVRRATRSTASSARWRGRRRRARSSTSATTSRSAIVDLAQQVQDGDGHRRAAAAQDRAVRDIGGKLPGRLPPRAVDPRRPSELLGFEPQVGLEEGLQSTLEWHLMLREERVAEAVGGRVSATRGNRDRGRAVGPARPRLQAVDRRDAALMSIGTLASGVLAYAFNVLAARSLGPESYGAIGALWAGMFLLAVLLFRPLEQTRQPRGRRPARARRRRAPRRALGRAPRRLRDGRSPLPACVAAWQPLTDGLFGGRPALTVALIVGLAGYGASYFARGLAGGVRWFGGYGLVLLADGAIRVVDRAAAAVRRLAHHRRHRDRRGGDRRRGRAAVLARPRGPAPSRRRAGRSDYDSARAVRFALPAAVIAGCEQILISGGPLLVLIAGGPGAAAAAGVLFAATLLVRAPVFLFQGVAGVAAAQPHDLPRAGRRGAAAPRHGAHRARRSPASPCHGARRAGRRPGRDVAAVRRRVHRHAHRPRAARGRDRRLPRRLHVLPGAARARSGAAAPRCAGSLAAATFVGARAHALGTPFHRVSVAFAVASGIAGAGLMAHVWKHRS